MYHVSTFFLARPLLREYLDGQLVPVRVSHLQGKATIASSVSYGANEEDSRKGPLSGHLLMGEQCVLNIFELQWVNIKAVLEATN
jgi:hypothetical protein